ncbi:MarR family winged helix-turn-helix transcriptional regulator [Trinickia fusca]|uniref:MarR family transcriptional regulator n=1 Tax=Trinickia fusca TaxID=2419777 RepID=A0A494XXH1_9BURK|nr:MarR family winged helix-turn-helix transcriptional regulator [Trinickia fusca]RKP52293.1 MarR family transcriptional regulator [Trinickia fusca]
MNEIDIGSACNCFAMRQAARFVTQIYERHFAPLGVTATQYSIMVALSRRRDLLMSELADALVMDRTTLLRALKPLQRDDIVSIARAEHDARAYSLNLTRDGLRLFKQATKAWQAAQTEFEDKFGQSRARALRQELFSLTTVD